MDAYGNIPYNILIIYNNIYYISILDKEVSRVGQKSEVLPRKRQAEQLDEGREAKRARFGDG